MAKKLFKSISLASNGPVIEDDLEGMEDTFAEEEAESYEATDEVDADVGEISDLSDSIDVAQEDHAVLEEQAETLETELADPEYEGMEEVTALSIRTTLRVLANNHGLTFPNLEGKITKQSFAGKSRAVRIDRSRAVLLGVKDAIVEIWEKIKAALKLMWDKVKAFWNKHFSTLGRLEKAFVSARKKAKALKGTPDYTKEIKAGSNLNNLFQEGKEVDGKLIIGYLHTTIGEIKSLELVRMATLSVGKNIDDIYDGLGKEANIDKSSFHVLRSLGNELTSKGSGDGEESAIGGWKYKIEVEGSDDDAKLNYVEDNTTYSGDEDRKIVIASKPQLDELLSKGLDLVKEIIKSKKGRDAYDKKIAGFVDNINKSIDKLGEADDVMSKAYKASYMDALKTFQKLSGINAKVETKGVSYAIKGLKGALQYGKLSMKAYKKS